MISYEWYRAGDLFGMRYCYQKGDVLPRHAHAKAEEHNVIVLSGAVCLELDGEPILLGPGTIHDFPSDLPHSIRCVSDSAITLHMYLHGIPEGYAELPESDHSGTI